jgi:prepilin-type N-terminal cleavage/methylation domain-containing protein
MKSYRQQSGVSMIEVLIAILVSVIGLFSAMKLQLTAVSNTHSA